MGNAFMYFIKLIDCRAYIGHVWNVGSLRSCMQHSKHMHPFNRT